nr:uncharacterized protein LOC113693269 [Coffea arabica]
MGVQIARLPYAHPHSGERYYLRMLLHKIRDGRSFEHLRTIDGVVHPTFKAACATLGLSDDYNEWNEALAEASTWASAKKLRNILIREELDYDFTSEQQLFDNLYASLNEDQLKAYDLIMESYTHNHGGLFFVYGSGGTGKVSAILLAEFGESNWIRMLSQFLIKNDSQSLMRLIDSVYPNLRNSYKNSTYLKECAILAPKNGDVDKLNDKMPSILLSQSRAYMSADTFCNTKGDISEGLCNGTRLVVTRIGDKVLKAKVITGSNIRDLVLIPHISLTPQSARTPFPIKRRQFPVKVAFAMTINKSQGQTLKNVGVYLPEPVFAHGQLYVALSRATSPVGLKILIVNRDNDPWNYTKNIVYREIFDSL